MEEKPSNMSESSELMFSFNDETWHRAKRRDCEHNTEDLFCERCQRDCAEQFCDKPKTKGSRYCEDFSPYWEHIDE